MDRLFPCQAAFQFWLEIDQEEEREHHDEQDGGRVKQSLQVLSDKPVFLLSGDRQPLRRLVSSNAFSGRSATVRQRLSP